MNAARMRQIIRLLPNLRDRLFLSPDLLGGDTDADFDPDCPGPRPDARGRPGPTDFDRAGFRLASLFAQRHLADAAQIVPTEGGTRVRVARVPLSGDDFSHEVDTYALRCGSREIRFLSTDTYDGTGELAERYEESVEAWDTVSEGTNYGFLYEVVCEEKRSAQGSYPSVTAFIGQTRN